MTDPFGTAALRTATLTAWADSPTRFREDANAEEDLRLGGYADTWFVELAQNAADAARASGIAGRLRVCLVDGELRVANTGAPLDPAGVAALAALRASAKRDDPGAVGRFGVGFAAVLGVSDEPRLITARGGVAFSARATAQAVRELPGPAAELARRGGQLAVLRLVWPTGVEEPPPPAGYDTEVRLPVRPGVDPAALLATATAGAPDLLLALPDLVEIDIDGRVLRRVHDPLPHIGATTRSEGAQNSSVAPTCEQEAAADGVLAPECDRGGVVRIGEQRWLLARATVDDADDAASEQRGRRQRELCWALPLDANGRPAPLDDDVLHAPTATTERVGLPARLIADLPLDPDRRHVRSGPGTDRVLQAAAGTYPGLVAALAPDDRLALVPAAGFPRSAVDGQLRALLLDVLRTTAWLPTAAGGDLAPARATWVDLPAADDLPALLADVVPGLVAPRVVPPPELGVHRLGAADLVDRLLGVDRPSSWWRALYAALAPAVDTVPGLRDELGALPVPLTDGRVVAGPARVLLPVDGAWPADAPALPGLHVVAPDAVHPLLVRLGAAPADPLALLDHPALREAVDRSIDDAEAGLDPAPLAEAVLGLVAEVGPTAAAARGWLAGLALTDVDGEPARADELMLPDAALRPVLADDAPLAVLAADWPARIAREVLVAVGVVDGFTVVRVSDAGAVDAVPDVDDLDRWLDEQPEPPDDVAAVRDLDLVADDAWPAALALLGAHPDTRAALLAPRSFTAWWLTRHARLHGRRPGHWRLASAVRLAGLYDPLPEAADDEAVLAAAGVRADLDVADVREAADLLARLADPSRRPDAALVSAAYAALAAAVVDGRLDVTDLDPPERVRTLNGSVADAANAVVLDAPWLAAVLPADTIVAGGEPRALADLLDLPMAAEVVDGDVVGEGRGVPWSALPEVVVTCHTLGVAVPVGELHRHEELVVVAARAASGSTPGAGLAGRGGPLARRRPRAGPARPPRGRARGREDRSAAW